MHSHRKRSRWKKILAAFIALILVGWPLASWLSIPVPTLREVLVERPRDWELFAELRQETEPPPPQEAPEDAVPVEPALEPESVDFAQNEGTFEGEAVVDDSEAAPSEETSTLAEPAPKIIEPMELSEPALESPGLTPVGLKASTDAEQETEPGVDPAEAEGRPQAPTSSLEELLAYGGSLIEGDVRIPGLVVEWDAATVQELIGSGAIIVLAQSGEADRRRIYRLYAPQGGVWSGGQFQRADDVALRNVSLLVLQREGAESRARELFEQQFRRSNVRIEVRASNSLSTYIARKQFAALGALGFTEASLRARRVVTAGVLDSRAGRPVFVIEEVRVGGEIIPFSDPEARARGDI